MNNSGIFFDSANLKELKKWFATGILGGATTNPVILQKDGVLDVPGHVQKMIDITGPDFPISIEIPDSTMSRGKMIALSIRYHGMFPHNAVIKIPMDCRDSKKSLEVMYTLCREGVKVNATIGLTSGQLIGAAEALRHGKGNYVSLFWGRCEEAGGAPAEKTLTTTLKYLRTHFLVSRVIVGSIREVEQIDRAFELGAHVVTIPPKFLEEWMFTKRGVETADEFNKAYRDVEKEMRLI